MIITSEKYKDEMAKAIRNSTQIRITHYMNTDLELYATITPYSYYTTLPTRLSFSDLSLDYSSISSVWRNYAYLGKDSMKTTGEQMILPETEHYPSITSQSGFIPDAWSDNTYSNLLNGYDYGGGVYFEWGVVDGNEYINFDGLIFNFDDTIGVYPTKIKIEILGENFVEIYNETFDNDNNYFVFENNFSNIRKLKVTFLALNKPLTYMRIKYFHFGIAKTYTNEDLMIDAFTFEKKADFLSNELSYSTLSFNVKNYPIIYDGEDQLGIYEYYTDYQPIKFELGIELDDQSIEWVHIGMFYTFGKILLKSNYFTINAKDLISTYISTNDFVSSVEGQTYSWYDFIYYSYYSHSSSIYRNIYNDKKIPLRIDDEINNQSFEYNFKLDVNQSLQLVANFNNCSLYLGNNDNFILKDTLIPTVTISNNGETTYSDDEKMYYHSDFPEKLYANLQPNFMNLTGQTLIVAPDNVSDVEQFYYQSNIIGDDSGLFSTNPTITINKSISSDETNIYIAFDIINNTYAKDFTIKYYNDSYSLIDTQTITDNDQVIYIDDISLFNIKRIIIEIIEWSVPYRTPIIMKIGNGLMTNYYLEAKDMYSYPIKESFDKPSQITHKYHDYIIDDDWSEIRVVDGVDVGTPGNPLVEIKLTTEDYYADIYYELVSGTEGTMKSWKYANGYLITSTDTYTPISYRFYGKKRTKKDYKAIKNYSNGSLQYSVDNPYITTEEKALKQIDWYYDYINKGYTMRIDYRGDPSLEVMDFIYVETKTKPRTPVVITKTKLKYNGGLSGEMEVMKI